MNDPIQFYGIQIIGIKYKRISFMMNHCQILVRKSYMKVYIKNAEAKILMHKGPVNI